jgi:two-component system chemotaxis response regulator CheY
MSAKNLLVVDDSATARMLITLTLKKNSDYRMSEAGDGAEAVDKLGSDSFDLVLTDLKMPKMDGLQLITYIRSKHSRPDLPIIVITTKGEESDRDKGLELGANAYLSKPVNGAQLMEQVRKILANGE